MHSKINPCKIPKARYLEKWKVMHAQNLITAKTEKCEIIFIGDSIIANMVKSTLWSKHRYLNCVNFGIGGDRTEHVLYRIQNGEIGSLTTKIVVLLVGTNNNYTKPFNVLEGILECVDAIQQRVPDVHIILPTLLPRGQYPNELRKQNAEVNELLIRVGEFEMTRAQPSKFQPIHVIPIGDFLKEDEEISDKIMYDFLHLTDVGYSKCFASVFEKVIELLKS